MRSNNTKTQLQSIRTPLYVYINLYNIESSEMCLIIQFTWDIFISHLRRKLTISYYLL